MQRQQQGGDAALLHARGRARAHIDIGGSGGGGGGGNRRGGARALSPTGRVKLMRATQSRGGSAVSRSTSALPRS